MHYIKYFKSIAKYFFYFILDKLVKFKMHKDFESKFFVKELMVSTLFIEPIIEFKWFILVSKIDVPNILHLKDNDKLKFWQEIDKVADAIDNIYRPFQINIAMLGNKTRILHAHIIARFENDTAWPDSPFGYKFNKADNAYLYKISEDLKNHI